MAVDLQAHISVVECFENLFFQCETSAEGYQKGTKFLAHKQQEKPPFKTCVNQNSQYINLLLKASDMHIGTARDKYAKRTLWHDLTTSICVLNEDGTVTWTENFKANNDVLRNAVESLIKECEEKRQRILNIYTKRDREWEG